MRFQFRTDGRRVDTNSCSDTVLLFGMRLVPDRINAAWISTLADEDLLDIESRLYERFAILDRRHKQLRGRDYNLLRGPTPLIDAWDRWSRVAMATKTRSLIVRRHEMVPKAG